MKKRFTLPRQSYLPLALLFWIGLWWLSASLLDIPLLLPTPLAVLKALWRLIRTALFWKTVAVSLIRIMLGILLIRFIKRYIGSGVFPMNWRIFL